MSWNGQSLMSKATIHAIVFDLGKVLVDFDYSIATRRIWFGRSITGINFVVGLITLDDVGNRLRIAIKEGPSCRAAVKFPFQHDDCSVRTMRQAKQASAAKQR